uniref:Transmembrane protein n=1 Tax=Davidia involucrata TaxID=16924 RepID=A0A5B7BUU6_DAVIN
MRFVVGSRRRRLSVHAFLIACAVFTGVGLLILTLRSVDPSTDIHFPIKTTQEVAEEADAVFISETDTKPERTKGCATVEEMGEIFGRGFWEESLKVRKIIQHHFVLNGPSRIRGLPPEQFCKHGFVIGKASEAGFGNEMYKILTAAALSVMLNRSLIIGQTRGKYPFGDYISYTNLSFTLKEVKHLWRQNGCVIKYGRHLVMRIDDFQKPRKTNVLCSNWREWEQPIIWFQNTTDAVAAQFFLKNVHLEMRNAASDLFGQPDYLQHRPNVFGELMRVLISPSEDVKEAVNWVLGSGVDPDISLHMRMLMNRSVRAVQAALNCIRTAMRSLQLINRPRVVLVSDSPSLIKDIAPDIDEFAEVLHFDYELFKGNISSKVDGFHNSDFRVKDWGPAPRWVAFVDFFLAIRAKHAVVSGAHRRVGTTYAQLIAALAAAHRLVENSSAGSKFSFFSSFQSNLLSEGLGNQVGWGHVWNRFAGPLSCCNQTNQCALTPLLPPAWWDGLWQSPISRDVHRMEAYGIQLSGFGTFEYERLQSVCNSRKNVVVTVPLI